MDFLFPHPVKLQSNMPSLESLRHAPFQNIDGEMFSQTKLNGRWKIDMQVAAIDRSAHLALSAFVTSMKYAGAFCRIPVCVQYRPNDFTGRQMACACPSSEWLFDHSGFANDPFPGFTLINDVKARDSYVDVNVPELSNIQPGMFFSLTDGPHKSSLYKVLHSHPLDENPLTWRLHVAPLIRGNHAAGDILVVDQLSLRCWMESGDEIGVDTSPFKFSKMTFIEAF